MKTNGNVTITVQEIASLVRKHIKEKGYEVPADAKVRFKVTGKEDPTDYHAAYPLSYELDSATLEVIVKEPK